MTETPPTFDVTTAATQLVDELVAALVNSRIYELSHPRVQGSLARVRELVAQITAATGTDRVRIGCSEGMLFHGPEPLVAGSIAATRLVQIIAGWRAGGIEVVRHVSSEELATFFACLLERPAPGDDFLRLSERAAARHCLHAALLPPAAVAHGLAPGDDGHAEALQRTQQTVDALQAVTVAVCRGGTIDFAPVQAEAEAILAHLERGGTQLLGITRQGQYDAFTFGHSMRVAILAVNFARALTDDRDLHLRIGAAALLHDVGKALIPFEILHSTKPLTPEEKLEMDKHAELGARCLLDHHDSDPLAIVAAFGHHLTPDGKGYPKTTHQHPACFVASVVKICDVYEALTAARPYKRPMSPVRAYRVMIAMGTGLDQRLLRRFIEVHGIHPVGQEVELATGEAAVVESQTDDPMHPVVRLLTTPEGEPIADGAGELLDLREVACPQVRAILRELVHEKQPAAVGS
ncbi:MAG: HD domain-containing protein [Planctomycetota bacterium]